MESNKQSTVEGTPKAELKIDESLVASLLREQHPDLAPLPIRLADSGWDNVMFRLGDQLSVRLPRRKIAAKLIEHEQIWLPIIAQRLNIPIPTPIRLGKPTAKYPWRWSILPCLEGVTADRELPNQDEAKLFGLFLRSLHQPAPPDAPDNSVRGVPLKQRATALETRIKSLKSKTDLITPEIEHIWHRALDTPVDVEAKWLHGDLHPGNVLVRKGIIVGVIDWGDLTSGDVATDLASFWLLFGSKNVRQEAIAEYGNVSLSTLHRAKGWAIYFAVTLLDVGLVDNPDYADVGKRTLSWVAEDELLQDL